MTSAEAFLIDGGITDYLVDFWHTVEFSRIMRAPLTRPFPASSAGQLRYFTRRSPARSKPAADPRHLCCQRPDPVLMELRRLPFRSRWSLSKLSNKKNISTTPRRLQPGPPGGWCRRSISQPELLKRRAFPCG